MHQLVSYHVRIPLGREDCGGVGNVLLIKTQTGYRGAIEQVIREHINYTNFIAEIAPEFVNEGYLKWLNTEVPLARNREGSE